MYPVIRKSRNYKVNHYLRIYSMIALEAKKFLSSIETKDRCNFVTVNFSMFVGTSFRVSAGTIYPRSYQLFL